MFCHANSKLIRILFFVFVLELCEDWNGSQEPVSEGKHIFIKNIIFKNIVFFLDLTILFSFYHIEVVVK